MPRQNRYHPYANSTRQSSQASAAPAAPAATPQLPSPQRYPQLPTLSIPRSQPLSTIPELEQAPTHSNIPPIQPIQTLQPIYPAYIRGTTTDGKALLTKSILQGPNGVFYIEMQTVRYPSECVGYSNSSHAGAAATTVNDYVKDYAGIGDMYERWVANGPGPTYLDPSCGTDIKRSTTPLSHDSGVGSTFGSDDGRSGHEHDEDAEGEDEAVFEEFMVVMEGSGVGCSGGLRAVGAEHGGWSR